MNFLRNHWYDLGVVFAVLVLMYIIISHHQLTTYQLLMWLNLVTLFLHQLEEYRIAATFPGMLNTVMYHSKMPDRYQLNSNTAFYVNEAIGWTCYFLAAVFAHKAVWLGIATIMVSIGNTIAHTLIFNIKGKMIYNAGMVTSLVLFVPCTNYFFSIICKEHLADVAYFIIGIPLGIVINIIGVLKLIDWMADEKTVYVFDDRNLLPQDRKKISR